MSLKRSTNSSTKQNPCFLFHDEIEFQNDYNNKVDYSPSANNKVDYSPSANNNIYVCCLRAGLIEKERRLGKQNQ